MRGFGRFFEALFSTARAGEFEVLSARGCVALLLTRSHARFVLEGGMGSGFGEERAWLQGFGRFFEALFSAAGAGELIVLSARGCVALLLTRSHARFVLLGGVGSGFGEGTARLQGFGRFFEALFSSARAGEIEVLSGSRVRRFAPYPLTR
jgi:hypothetical protein